MYIIIYIFYNTITLVIKIMDTYLPNCILIINCIKPLYYFYYFILLPIVSYFNHFQPISSNFNQFQHTSTHHTKTKLTSTHFKQLHSFTNPYFNETNRLQITHIQTSSCFHHVDKHHRIATGRVRVRSKRSLFFGPGPKPGTEDETLTLT